jgi:hypothetical protein
MIYVNDDHYSREYFSARLLITTRCRFCITAKDSAWQFA